MLSKTLRRVQEADENDMTPPTQRNAPYITTIAVPDKDVNAYPQLNGMKQDGFSV